MNFSDSDILSSSCRLHSSNCSILSVSSDIELSLISAIDRDSNAENQSAIMPDELPKFRIREISPLSRSVSPIIPASLEHDIEQLDASEYLQSIDYVSVCEVDAQIQPPSDLDSNENNSCLETIYEGVYLNTPNKTRRIATRNLNNLIKTNILLKEGVQSIPSTSAGKENQQHKILQRRSH